jgi:hypothetical protein
MEKKSPDWDALAKRADDQVSGLTRAIHAVDRFNPMYFCILGSILVGIAGLAAASATEMGANLTDTFAFVCFIFVCALGLASAVLSFREALLYNGRWKRAKSALARALREAEELAGFGFVSTDKLDHLTDDDDVKRKLVLLRDAIREGRERLGVRD